VLEAKLNTVLTASLGQGLASCPQPLAADFLGPAILQTGDAFAQRMDIKLSLACDGVIAGYPTPRPSDDRR